MSRYDKINPDNINLQYSEVIDSKVKALKQVYHDWGVTLRSALKQESGSKYTGELSRAIRFKVTSSSIKNGIPARVSLMVGVLDPDSPALKYLKFVLYGTRPHFAPIKYRGRTTEVLKWARSKDLVYRDGKHWRWSSGKHQGEIFTGIPNVGNTRNNFFQRVYSKYYSQIKQDVERILGE